jgi:hypothetical protein
MKKINVKPLPASQTNISVLFSKKTEKAEKIEKAATVTKALQPTDVPSVVVEKGSDKVSQYYETLSERERIAHEIAKEKLGTSYDITRTHGYLNWLRLQKV